MRVGACAQAWSQGPSRAEGTDGPKLQDGNGLGQGLQERGGSAGWAGTRGDGMTWGSSPRNLVLVPNNSSSFLCITHRTVPF